jgi:hypothetical protein
MAKQHAAQRQADEPCSENAECAAIVPVTGSPPAKNRRPNTSAEAVAKM